MRSLKKAIGIILALLLIFAAALVILNAKYFWLNIKYTLSHKNNSPAQVSSVEKRDQPNYLRIPSLNINAPVVFVDQNSETVFQKALQTGVVHYPGTANVGDYGNDYIFGHSSDYIFTPGQFKTVFALLPRISKGAEIDLFDSSGKGYVYIVKDSHEVAKTDLSVLGQGNNTQQLLTLQTSYPVGTAIARWVVIAELQK